MLRLVLKPDSVLIGHMTKNVQIGVWYIPREHNQLADSLAKAAAVKGDVAIM
jgi:ribonuclease HI